MAAIDSEKWDRAVSKVMKEAEQYLIYDGLLISEDVSEDFSMDTSVPSSVNLVVEENVSMSEGSSDVRVFSTTPHDSSVSGKKRQSKSQKTQLKSLVVRQCTEEAISPCKLAEIHGISEKTVRNWVKKSGAQLPSHYKESLSQVSSQNMIVDQTSASTSNTVTLKDSKELITKLKSKWPSLASADDNNLKCPKCNFETSKQHSLELHVKSIHVDCELCGHVFFGCRAKFELAGHLKKHQAQEPKQYLCEFCQKDCKYKQNVKKHMKICHKRNR